MKNIIKVITLCPVLSHAGQFIDKESMGNTSYLNARYLNHNLGRFLNQDALQEYNGHYSYQHGDVMLFSDPSGLTSSDDEGGIIEVLFEEIDEELSKKTPPPKEEVTKEAGKEDPEHAKDTNSVIDAGSGVTHGKGDLPDQSGTPSASPTTSTTFDYDAASLSGKFEPIPHLKDFEDNTPHEDYARRTKKRLKVKQLDELSSSGSEQSDMENGYTVEKDTPAPSYHSQNSHDLGEYDSEPRYESESPDEKAKRRAKFTDKIAIGIFVGVLFFTIAGTALGFHLMGAF